MLFSEMAGPRRYQLKERARRQEETRRRITAATVALHEEVGPAATTITEVARRAGVQRLTVYTHFPDERALFAACNAHWSAAHPAPEIGPWRQIGDPARRVGVALSELYGYYAENQRMLANVTRDARALPDLAAEVAATFDAYMAEVVATLAAGWGLRGRRRERLEALLELVLAFEGWQTLAGRTGGDTERAAEIAADLVRDAAGA